MGNLKKFYFNLINFKKCIYAEVFNFFNKFFITINN